MTLPIASHIITFTPYFTICILYFTIHRDSFFHVLEFLMKLIGKQRRGSNIYVLDSVGVDGEEGGSSSSSESFSRSSEHEEESDEDEDYTKIQALNQALHHAYAMRQDSKNDAALQDMGHALSHGVQQAQGNQTIEEKSDFTMASDDITAASFSSSLFAEAHEQNRKDVRFDRNFGIG